MKRIGALFLIVMSLQVFGEQYRTLKEANANITLSEIGSSNGKIELRIVLKISAGIRKIF